MSLEFKITNPLKFVGWDKLLLSTEMCSFFHSAAWARVLHESYKYEPFYFTAINRDELFALLPIMEVKSCFTGKRGVSLPFSDYCYPIIEGEINFKDVLNLVLKYGENRNWRFLEIRGGQEFLQDISPYSCFYNHILDLSKDEEKVFSSFRDSTRRNIKKAVREGVEIDISKSLESINKFYQLNCLTRKTHGLPPQPYYFFRNIFNFVISRNFGFIVLASYKKITIAGGVFFHLGKKAFFKFGAMDRAYQHLRPSNLVMWEGIKWYCKNGYETINFGRTDMADIGLRQYKAGWGTKESIINYYRFNVKNESPIIAKTKESRIHNKIFNRMPVSLLKLIGSISYKHIG